MHIYIRLSYTLKYQNILYNRTYFVNHTSVKLGEKRPLISMESKKMPSLYSRAPEVYSHSFTLCFQLDILAVPHRVIYSTYID